MAFSLKFLSSANYVKGLYHCNVFLQLRTEAKKTLFIASKTRAMFRASRRVPRSFGQAVAREVSVWPLR